MKLGLHIYSPEWPHGDVEVVGTSEALTVLQRAISEALRIGSAVTPVVFVADGEGYEAHIVVLREGDERWSHLALPYGHEMSRECRDDVLWPYQIEVPMPPQREADHG